MDNKIMNENESLKEALKQSESRLKRLYASLESLTKELDLIKSQIKENQIEVDALNRSIASGGYLPKSKNIVDTRRKQETYNSNMQIINIARNMKAFQTVGGISFPVSAEFAIKNVFDSYFVVTDKDVFDRIKNNEFISIEKDMDCQSVLKLVNLYGEKFGEIINLSDVIKIKGYIETNTNFFVKMGKNNTSTFCRIAIY